MTPDEAPDPSGVGAETDPPAPEALPSDILEALPEQKRERLLEIFHERHIQFSGPLPYPGIMRDYEGILPGSADRITTMAENEQKQDHAIETKLVDAGIAAQDKGLRYTFYIAVIGLVLGSGLIALGKDPAGYALLIGAIGTIVAPFLKRESDRRAAAKQATESEE